MREEDERADAGIPKKKVANTLGESSKNDAEEEDDTEGGDQKDACKNIFFGR